MVESYKNKVIIAGCGPGLKAYISPKALYNIKKADILLGSRRLLKLFPNINAKKIIIEKNYKIMVDRIARWRSSMQVVVLVSGDPCFFSYAKMIVKKIGRESCIIIPGISSMQLAFAAIGECWDNASFISLHGRNTGYERLIRKVRDTCMVGILTDNKNTPAVIARWLLERGIHDRRMFVCESLSLPEERVREMDLTSAVNIKTNGASVVIIKK
ncbi:MAG: precorrin-6y C5,15-methyltransferase (decarboxylating) subunit CbiE [Planctomycetes bacterium]|nr:precorrin-6y C5,15-methyltransferase (decarboxylating) subunit CbiE [Planctomycetota bacterium]MDE1889190.1 precorrin-6y C5,15-methyltransferase (decarboxylating) subunit CbiE [Planctomycetota bacterium]